MSWLRWRSFAVAWIMLVLLARGEVRAQSNEARVLPPTAAAADHPRGAWPIAAALVLGPVVHGAGHFAATIRALITSGSDARSSSARCSGKALPEKGAGAGALAGADTCSGGDAGEEG